MIYQDQKLLYRNIHAQISTFDRGEISFEQMLINIEAAIRLYRVRIDITEILTNPHTFSE